MKLLLVRHGLTDWNSDGRFQGQTDVPLNAAGKRQAEALAVRLSKESIDAIYASDLSRAADTANAIKAYHTCSVKVDVRLREIRFGAWEGQTSAQIFRDDPQTMRLWKTRAMEASVPGGETLGELAGRIRSFLDDLPREGANQTTIIVSHEGALNVMLCFLLGLSPAQFWRFRLAQASLTEVVSTSEGFVLNALSDTCHLA